MKITDEEKKVLDRAERLMRGVDAGLAKQLDAEPRRSLQKWQTIQRDTLQEIIDEFVKNGFVLVGLMFRDKKTGTFQPYIFDKK